MNKFLIHFSYLLVLNFELALFMAAAVYGGVYLNKEHPLGVNWLLITTPLSLVLCGYLVYRYLVRIIKIDHKKTNQNFKK